MQDGGDYEKMQFGRFANVFPPPKNKDLSESIAATSSYAGLLYFSGIKYPGDMEKIVTAANWIGFGLEAGYRIVNGKMKLPATFVRDQKPEDDLVRRPYYFHTHVGTDVNEFRTLIKTLPDAGTGKQLVYDGGPWQGYTTNLTKLEASNVATEPIVLAITPFQWVELDPPDDEPVLSKRDQRTSSQDYLKILSTEPWRQLRNSRMPNPPPLADYQFDPSLGKGSVIYVLDSGFQMNHPELAATTRDVVALKSTGDDSFPPNANPNLPFLLLDQRIESDHGAYVHGTIMATIGAGINYGVASNADLVLAKVGMSIQYLGQSKAKQYFTKEGVDDIFMQVLKHIREARAQAGDSKSRASYVVLITMGMLPNFILTWSQLTNSRISVRWDS